MKSGGNKGKIMLSFILGIIVGVAFAPFWIKCYEVVKEKTSPLFRKIKTILHR